MASPKSKTLDLDEEFGDRPDIPTKPFRYLKKNWTLLAQMNTFAYGQIVAGEDEDATKHFINFILTLVVEDERDAWGKALAAANLRVEDLQRLVTRLTEVAAAPVPTESPSVSPATPATRAPRRKSTAD